MTDESKVENKQCKLMPVTDLSLMPASLEACTKEPNDLEPEAFGQLQHHYGKALNVANCPCGSGKLFSECCRAFWRLAKSSWDQRETTAQKARKEAHKAELDATAQDRKDASKAEELCRILIMPNGQLAVQIANDKLPLVQVASALMEGHDKLILQMAAQQTVQMLQAISQQQQAHGQGGRKAPMTM